MLLVMSVLTSFVCHLFLFANLQLLLKAEGNMHFFEPSDLEFVCSRLQQQTQSGVQHGDRVHRPHLRHYGRRADNVPSRSGVGLPEGEGERFVRL